jgi:hypothetical protein
MAVLSKLAYIHPPNSSKKDDYLTTIFSSHVSSPWYGQTRFWPAEAGIRSHSRHTICFPFPNYTTVTRNSKQLNSIMIRKSLQRVSALKHSTSLDDTVRANADRFISHTLPQTVVGTSQNGVNLKDNIECLKSERCLKIKFL